MRMCEKKSLDYIRYTVDMVKPVLQRMVFNFRIV